MGVTIHGLSLPVSAAVLNSLADCQGEVAVIGFEAAPGRDLHATDAATWQELVATLRAAFFAIRSAAQRFGEQGGSIVVVVPAHALRTSRGCGIAAIGGSFMVTVAQVAAVEFGERGIRVNVVAVGPLEGSVPARTLDAIPMGRLAQPKDVGNACRMLASPDAAHVTGAISPVDGGYVITKAVGGSPFAI